MTYFLPVYFKIQKFGTHNLFSWQKTMFGVHVLQYIQ